MNALQWLILERRLIEAQNSEEYPFIFLSILQKLLKCQIGITYKKRLNTFVVTDAMHVSEVDRQSTTIEWLEKKLLPTLSAKVETLTVEPPASLGASNHLLHLPIFCGDQFQWGVVCFIDKASSESEVVFFKTLSEHVGALYGRFIERKLNHRLDKYLAKKKLALALVGLFILGFIKLPQTILAPAEVMPIKPELVAPSVDGVIKKLLVLPNQVVKKGQKLVELDDILIKNKLEEATQKLTTNKARYLKAYRNAYLDPSARNELVILKNEVQQARIEQAHYQNLLKRTVISAQKEGVALYSSPSEFLGKPIKIGQKIMLIANPLKTKINFWIPIDTIVTINQTKPLVLYPNLHPLATVKAKLQYVNPIAEAMPDGTLGFYGQAQILKGDIQLGEKGTIKLYGPAKPIWALLLQRPFRFLRQTLGI